MNCNFMLLVELGAQCQTFIKKKYAAKPFHIDHLKKNNNFFHDKLKYYNSKVLEKNW